MKKFDKELVYLVISFFVLAANFYLVLSSHYIKKELNQSKTECVVQQKPTLL